MQIFRVIGQFIGKALLDSRIIDMSFNKIFMKFVLDEDVPLTIATLEVRLLVIGTPVLAYGPSSSSIQPWQSRCRKFRLSRPQRTPSTPTRR